MRSFGCKDLDATQNPNLRLIALGDDLTVQLLSNLEQLGDYSCNVLRNMRGKILGYNTGHDTNDYWVLKNKVQDLIDAKEIEFDAPEIPNVITTPVPKHAHNTNAIEEDMFVTSVDEL